VPDGRGDVRNREAPGTSAPRGTAEPRARAARVPGAPAARCHPGSRRDGSPPARPRPRRGARRLPRGAGRARRGSFRAEPLGARRKAPLHMALTAMTDATTPNRSALRAAFALSGLLLLLRLDLAHRVGFGDAE